MSKIITNIAYTLWTLRGSNKLDELIYYDNSFQKLTDDLIHLRGAYGPRLRQWIGADQLQACINENQDIDQPEDFTKPKGIDQLQQIYKDIMNGITIVSCSVFDPSIDFEESNNIPDLLNISFRIKNGLRVIGIFNSLKNNPHYENGDDEFLLSVIAQMMGSITNNKSISLLLMNLEEETYLMKPVFMDDLKITNSNPESLWNDVHNLFEFEHFLRNSITQESINLKMVDSIKIADEIIKKFIPKIGCEFWKEIAYMLMLHVFNSFGKDNAHKEYVETFLKVNIKGVMNKYINEV